MSSQDEAYMDDYDYYQHTGELSEYFEDDDEYEDDDEDDDEYDDDEYDDDDDDVEKVVTVEVEKEEKEEKAFSLAVVPVLPLRVAYKDEVKEKNEEEEEYIEYQTTENTVMSNVKLNYFKEFTEIDDAAAAKYGAELKSFVFRNINDCLTLYMEFAAIEGRRPKGDLFIDTVLYDNDGDIFNSQTEFIEASYFNGFQVVKFEFEDIQPSDVGHIKIHMKKC